MDIDFALPIYMIYNNASNTAATSTHLGGTVCRTQITSPPSSFYRTEGFPKLKKLEIQNVNNNNQELSISGNWLFLFSNFIKTVEQRHRSELNRNYKLYSSAISLYFIQRMKYKLKQHHVGNKLFIIIIIIMPHCQSRMSLSLWPLRHWARGAA